MISAFLQALGISGKTETTVSASEAVIKERDEAIAALTKAEGVYNKLHAEHEALKLKLTSLTEAAAAHAATVTALTTAKETAEKAKTDFEAALPGQIKTEAIRLAASQGVKIENVPPPAAGGADTGDKEAAITAAITAMNAERDPVKKGKLLKALDALRAVA